MAGRETEQWLIEGKVMVRPEPNGEFDELFLMEGKECRIHAEMMDRDKLWIGIYPAGEDERRVCMWITAKGRKLIVTAMED